MHVSCCCCCCCCCVLVRNQLLMCFGGPNRANGLNVILVCDMSCTSFARSAATTLSFKHPSNTHKMICTIQPRPAACMKSQLRQHFAPGAPVRRSLVQLRRLTLRRATDNEFGEDLSDIMKQDMERFAKRQQQQQQQQQQPSAASAASQAQAAGGSPLKEAVDKVLIADFFFVLAVLAWLGVGLVEKGALHSSNLIDAWMPLWPMVFQPAIGILMAGALVSGGLNWLASRGSES